jgi:hypothetical protein
MKVMILSLAGVFPKDQTAADGDLSSTSMAGESITELTLGKNWDSASSSSSSSSSSRKSAKFSLRPDISPRVIGGRWWLSVMQNKDVLASSLAQ